MIHEPLVLSGEFKIGFVVELTRALQLLEQPGLASRM
jgi:hypothetical protein